MCICVRLCLCMSERVKRDKRERERERQRLGRPAWLTLLCVWLLLGHVGADSGYGFNAAVRSLKQRRMSEASKSDLVAPITAAPPLPPETAESVIVISSSHQIFLPRRDLCI